MPAAVPARRLKTSQVGAGLPPGTRVAHKTGAITAVLRDGGIVNPPRRTPT